MKFLLPIIIVGGIFALLFLLERLFPLRPSTRSLFRRLVVNLAISALTFAVAISLVQPAAHWALRWSAEKPFGLVHLVTLLRWLEFAVSFLLMDLSSNFLEHELFSSIIPSVYVYRKGLPISIHFKIEILRTSVFPKVIISNVPKDNYTVFIRVRYNYDSYFMAGNQFGFGFYSDSDIQGLFSVLMGRLKDAFERYKLTEDDVVYVELSFRPKDKKLLSEFSLDKPSYITPHEIFLTEKKLTIPVSTNDICRAPA